MGSSPRLKKTIKPTEWSLIISRSEKGNGEKALVDRLTEKI